RRLAAFGIALTAIVAIGLAVPIVAAIPGLAGLFSATDQLTLDGVKSESVRRGGVDTILIVGDLVNRTGRDLDVPAIRISLRTAMGGEVYSWEVEPTTARIGASETIGFRS